MPYHFVLTLIGCLAQFVGLGILIQYQISSLYKNVGSCHILVQSKMQQWHRTSVHNPQHNILWQASPRRSVRTVLSIYRTPPQSCGGYHTAIWYVDHVPQTQWKADLPRVRLRRSKPLQKCVICQKFCYCIQQKHNLRGFYETDRLVRHP